MKNVSNTFPNEEKVILQNNRSDIYPLGNLWATMSIDLESNLGAIRLTPRLKLNTSSATQATLGVPVVFKYFDSKIWTIAGTRVFKTTGFTPDSPFTEDASTGAQTDYTSDESDAELFNFTLCTTTTDALMSKAFDGSGTGAWTSRDVLTAGAPHLTLYFKYRNRLYYTDEEVKIRSIDTAWATADPGVDYALELNRASDFITSLTSSTQSIWIGTMNTLNSGAYGVVYEWDGISAQPTNQYLLKANGAMALVNMDQTIYVMDSNGVLSAQTGYAFEEVARLPYGSFKPYRTFSRDNDRFIHPNGMYVTKNGTIRMIINNRESSGNVVENIPSGIWEWSKAKGLVHVEPFTYNPAGSTTITDYGQNLIDRVGAIAAMDTSGSNTTDGTIICGASIYTNATATVNAIFFDNSLDTIQKKGYFVSDWIEADGIEDDWSRLYLTFRKFLNAGDTIVGKYRLDIAAPVQFTLTWVDTTHFTTTTDLSAYAPSAAGYDGYYGGEIEILAGTGGASCAHITAISGAGTFTVTLDTAITGVTTGTAIGRAQSWKKMLPEITPTNVPNNVGKSWGNIPINGVNSRVQLKLCKTWTGQDEIYRWLITSKELINIQ